MYLKSFLSKDTSPYQTHNLRRGFWRFIGHNTTVLLALVAGLALTIAVIVFTAWLGKQVIQCPTWALSCTVPNSIEMIEDKKAVIQGLVTALYTTGITALAYATHAISETALWPLLAKRPMTLKQIETYVQACRGSIPSSSSALFMVRNLYYFIVLVCTILITLVPLSSAPLVGYVYQEKPIPQLFNSEYQSGGGIGPFFRQGNPPTSVREDAASLYTSWASAYVEEPLKENREWFIDRNLLESRGNMSVIATKVNRNITCRSWKPPPPKMEKDTYFNFTTNMNNMTKGTKRPKHGDYVRILRRTKLAVWAHDYLFPTPTRTVTTLVFAAVNGSIEGGFTMTDLPKNQSGNRPINRISMISCDVDLEMVEDTLIIGLKGNDGPPAKINTMADITITQPASNISKARWDPVHHPEDTLNELLLWFTMAPVTNGVSIEGAQPMYRYSAKPPNIPVPSTTTSDTDPNDKWNITYIENFMQASIGASLLGDSKGWLSGTTRNFTSSFDVSKLEPSRYKLLFIPPIIVLVNGVILLFISTHLHRSLRIPVMRLATLSEVLKSSQTDSLCRSAARDMLESSQLSKLENVSVDFNAMNNRTWGLQVRKGVSTSEGRELIDVQSLSE